MDIKGRAAIVTGAASGMGAGTAVALAAAGAKVALFDLNQAGLAEMAEKTGGLPVVCDVSDAESTEAAVAKAKEAHGPARVLVNSAGVPQMQPTIGPDGVMTLAEFNRIIGVNLSGTFNTIRLVAADLMAEDPVEDGSRGVIVNVSSASGHDGSAGQPAYVASKGGIIAMTLALAREFGDAGIRVMTISPGTMPVPAHMNAGPWIEKLLTLHPFPKRIGKHEEFAGLVMHIIENSFLNGEVIRFDAGSRVPYRLEL